MARGRNGTCSAAAEFSLASCAQDGVSREGRVGPTFHDVTGSLCVAAVEVLTAVYLVLRSIRINSLVVISSLVRRSHEPSDSASW